ncbi:MAG: O-antigen ligase family protein, partial [Candidatus Omnitrophica bacterium]|nr:O-antigen ligase family protein [Candidatus Omnitrophota bacterium]
GMIPSERSWAARALLVTGTFLMVAALLFTKCRTVWIAFFLSALMFAWLVVKQLKIPFWPALIAGSLGLAVIVLAGVYTHAFELVAKRFYAVWSGQDTKYYSLLYRLELWQGCLTAILARPMGWGIGAFRFIFPRFRVNEDRFVADYAHNEILHLGVDWGLPGVILAVLLVFFLWRAFRLFWGDITVKPEVKIRGAALAAALGAVALACLTDFPLRIYTNGIYFALSLAVGCHLFEASQAFRENFYPWLQRFPERGAAWFGKALAAGAGLLILLAAGQGVAQIHSEQGRRLEGDFRWDEAGAAYEKAARWSVIHAPTYEKLADLYRKRMSLSMDRNQRAEWRRVAIQYYEKALKLNPYVATDYYFLALLQEEEGGPDEVLQAFEQAMAKDPRNAFYVLEAGRYALRVKDVRTAVESFEKFKTFKLREIPNSDPCGLLKECMELTTDYLLLKRIIPDEWMYHQCFGMLLAGRQAWGHAQTEFDLALSRGREGRPAEEYYRYIAVPIADFYVSQNKFEEALRVYRNAPAGSGIAVDREARIRDLSGRLSARPVAGVAA